MVRSFAEKDFAKHNKTHVCIRSDEMLVYIVGRLKWDAGEAMHKRYETKLSRNLICLKMWAMAINVICNGKRSN